MKRIGPALFSCLLAATAFAAADATTPSIEEIQAAAATLVPPSGPPEVLPGGYLKVGFDRLSTYVFEVPKREFGDFKSPRKTGEEQIPAAIKALNGKKVMLTGFMLPVAFDKGLVTEFLLQKDQMTCCYGAMPAMNDWVHVKMKTGVKNIPDVPVSFYGTLKVGVIFDNVGLMNGLYVLEGERMAPQARP